MRFAFLWSNAGRWKQACNSKHAFSMLHPVRTTPIVLAVIFTTIMSTALPALSADATWQVLETPRFTVLSAANEKSTLAWSEEFNQFLDALGKVLTINERALPKLAVIMFRSDRGFKPYKPLETTGKVNNSVAGVFVRSGPYSSIALATGFERDQTRHTVYHEAVHWYTSGVKESLPVWFDEGLAETFSTFRLKGENAIWGDIESNTWYLLKEYKLMNLEDLLAVRSQAVLFDDDLMAGIFYAQSWLLVHYLLYGVYEGPRTGLVDYIVKSQNQPRHIAFQEAFGMDYEAMEQQLTNYLKSGRYYHPQVPRTVSTYTPTFTAASAEFVHENLAKLAFANNRKEQLKLHAEALSAMSPDSALNFDIQALYAVRNNSEDGLIAAAERAIELGSTDAQTFVLLATVLDGRNEQVPDAITPLRRLEPAQARRIADLCLRALEINPRYEAAYELMAWALLNVDKITDADAAVFRQGVSRFPDQPEMTMGLAIVERANGDLEQALALIRQVDSRLGGDDRQRKTIGRIIDDIWILEEYQPRIASAVGEKRFDEANRLLDKLEAYDFEKTHNTTIRRQRNSLAILAQFHAAETAIRDERYADARSILEQIKTMEGVTPQTSRQADKMIEYSNSRDKRR